MRIALYARVSKREQAEGYSLDAQLDAMRVYTQTQGWEVMEEYIDAGYPGRDDKRPSFQHLIRDALEGKFDAILVHSLDRFARSRFVSVTYKALLRQHNVFVYSATEPVDPSDASSVITEGMLEVIHEWYSAKLAVETKKGMRRMVAEGGWPHRAPFGYENKRNNRETWLEVAVETGAMITHAFNEFSTGKYTLSSWAKTAWDLGYRNAQAGRIHKSQWHKIFRNRFYIGLITWDGEEYQGAWPTLVDPATFQRVQEILDRNRNIGRGPYSPHRDYLLSGFLWSVDSDSSMHGTVAKKRFCYYRSLKPCENGRRHHVRCEILEQAVAGLLYNVVMDDLQAIELFDPHLQLALKAAPTIGDVYEWLETLDEKRDVLCSVFSCICVKDQGIMTAKLKPLFCLVEHAPGSNAEGSAFGTRNSDLISYQILSESYTLPMSALFLPRAFVMES